MRQALYILERTAILAASLALTAGAQTQTPPAKPATPPPKAAAAQAPAPAKPATPAAPAAKPAAPAAKPATPAAKAPAHPVTVKPAPPPQKPKPAQAKAPAAKKPPEAKAEAQKKEEAAPVTIAAAHKRDPFLALVSTFTAGAGAPVHLPPGKAGLQVSTLRVEGVVRGPNGMVVVVTNPQNRTYFLHQGDRVFDGRLEQITMDAVTFQETGKDPFGKPIDRMVVKRIYQTAGEQQ